jgi:CRISPR/Cas system-associated exonuclease Cas4 (RecB family)
MPLAPEFQFSQGSLQDYVECKRRFQLRYIYALQWPALEVEPAELYEQHAADGEAFHRLIHQHLLGLPVDLLTRMAESATENTDDDATLTEETGEDTGRLLHWWENYLASGPAELPAARYPELTLSAPVGDYRLLAKYDLVAVEPGSRAIIVDWKTSRNRPTQTWLAQRLQTRVYRYVLTQAGSHLNLGAAILPGQIIMLYWFANHPDRPERLPYDETQRDADARFLSRLVNEITTAGEDDFPKTEDVRRCRFCAYRSLCDRGVEAGDMDEQAPEDEGEPEPGRDWLGRIDFEQVGEIAF